MKKEDVLVKGRFPSVYHRREHVNRRKRSGV